LAAWLGREAENVCFWIHDTPFAGQYSVWADGEPSGHFNDEKCVHIYALTRRQTDREGEWNNLRCSLLGEVYKSLAPVALCQKKYI